MNTEIEKYETVPGAVKAVDAVDDPKNLDSGTPPQLTTEERLRRYSSLEGAIIGEVGQFKSFSEEKKGSLTQELSERFKNISEAIRKDISEAIRKDISDSMDSKTDEEKILEEISRRVDQSLRGVDQLLIRGLSLGVGMTRVLVGDKEPKKIFTYPGGSKLEVKKPFYLAISELESFSGDLREPNLTNPKESDVMFIAFQDTFLGLAEHLGVEVLVDDFTGKIPAHEITKVAKFGDNILFAERLTDRSDPSKRAQIPNIHHGNMTNYPSNFHFVVYTEAEMTELLNFVKKHSKAPEQAAELAVSETIQ